MFSIRPQNPPRGRAETARPTQKFRIVRAPQGHDGKKKETVGRRHGIPPHTPPAVPPDFLNFEDSPKTKFELQVKTAANSEYVEKSKSDKVLPAKKFLETCQNGTSISLDTTTTGTLTKLFESIEGKF